MVNFRSSYPSFKQDETTFIHSSQPAMAPLTPSEQKIDRLKDALKSNQASKPKFFKLSAIELEEYKNRYFQDPFKNHESP